MAAFELDMNKYESFQFSNGESSASVYDQESSASVSAYDQESAEMNETQDVVNENVDSDSESDSSSSSESESEGNELEVDVSARSSNSGSNQSSSGSDVESEEESKHSLNVERLSDASNSELDSAGSGPEYNAKHSSSDSDGPNENRRKIVKSSTKRKQEIDTLKELWEKNPEEFGIRRSGRSRKGPARYNIGEDSESSDSGQRGGYSRPSQHKKKKQSQSWINSTSDSECEEGSSHGKKSSMLHNASFSSERKLPKSSSSQKINGKIRYREQSIGAIESDDLIDVEYNTSIVIEEEETEAIEKVLDHRLGKKGATGASTTVYSVEDVGDPNEIIVAESEEQYLIKWKKWAHLHNTWESEATLKEQKVQGLKKLQNYKNKLEQIAIWKSRATPEDLEYYECQQEVSSDVKTQHLRAERIIGYRPTLTGDGSEYEYFCKWAGLPYIECTWEDANLISTMFQDKIDQYFARQKSVKIPNKACEALKVRPKFIPYATQPEYVGGPNHLPLRDYQLDGLNWLASSWCKRSSVILADEMGLGKTIQTISFLNYLFSQHSVYGPFLLVVPLSTMTAWQREFEIWAPEMNVIVYVGDVNSRNVIREHELCHPGNKRLKFNALITTYELLSKDKTFLCSISWAVLAVDEAHRLKNEESLLYKSLCEFNTNHRLLITGTPLQNSLRELYALLHFIMPLNFPSWAEFEEEHQNTADKGYPKLHKQLVPYLLRRVKKDVEKSLPAKVERILRVEMTTIQKQYYKWILTKNYKALSKGLKGNQGSFNNIIMELKKCCNHAMLIRPVDNPHNLETLQLLIRCSGKLLLLDKLLCRLKETGHRVLIFSQMVRMLDILSEYMQLRRFSYQRLDGSIKGELRKQAMDHYNAEGSQDFCFLLSTRAGGLGINLTSADTVIIFDSDWNPQNDLQAQARAHRIGQKNQVNIYRLVTKNSVEEDIIERAKKKMVLDHLVIQRMDTSGRTIMQSNKAPSTTGNSSIPFNKEELSAILKFGAEELFKDDKEDLAEPEPQVDIDEILSRAEYREEQPTSAGEELLSAFKIASINFNEDEVGMQSGNGARDHTSGRDWDDIIPESERKLIEAEERQNQELQLYLPPRNRKSINRVSKYSDNDASDGDLGSKSDKDDSDEEKPKRRGRPRIKKNEAIKNFTDAEIKRFLKSYKKFAMPLTRLDAIAMDADLQGKSLSDLIKIGDLIKSGCEKVMKEHLDEANNKENKKSGPKKRGREKGPSFKVGGVSINAKTLFSNEAELEPLGIILPFDPEERKRWILNEHVRDAHFGMSWSVEDDSRLLRGVYKHGMGNWEAIKMDSGLELGYKILPDGEQKPQSKHLQTRCDYLLKVLKKMTMEPELEVPKAKRGRKPQAEKTKAVERGRKPKVLSKAFVENDDSDVNVDSTPSEETNSSIKKVDLENSVLDDKSNKEQLALAEKVPVTNNPDSESKKKKSKSKESKKSSKEKNAALQNNKEDKLQDSSVLQYPASSEPEIIDAKEGNVNIEYSSIFKECREQMMPVKKYLMKLHKKKTPDNDGTDKEFIKYVLKVGGRISAILKSYGDSENLITWREHLWNFVSEFTIQNAAELYTLYRNTLIDLKHKTSPEVKKDDEMERNSIIDPDLKISEKESNGHKPQDLSHKRHADEGSSGKNNRPPKKKLKSSSRESKFSERDGYDKQQPSPSYSNHSYGQKPIYSSSSIKPQTTTPGVEERHTNTHNGLSQGHADSWRRRDE